MVLALAPGAYPTVTVEAGEPGTRLTMSPRWDLPHTAVGYVGGMQLQQASRTYSPGRELFKLGGVEAFLPLDMADMPAPVSPADGQACQAARRTRLARAQGWLDMSDDSLLWRHWVSWSIGPARIILGQHRPHRDRRAYEWLGNSTTGIGVTVDGGAQGALAARLQVDLNCDFTYVPLGIYGDLLRNKSQALRVCVGQQCVWLPLSDGGVDAVRINRYGSTDDNNNDIVMGRLHARRFVIGTNVVSHELSVLPLDLLGPPINELDMLIWFGVLLAALCAWMLAIYPGACRTVYARLLAPFASAQTTRQDMSVFSTDNASIVESLVVITTLVTIGTAGVALFGFRLDTVLNIDLPVAYTRAIVWVAAMLALLCTAWPAVDCRPEIVQLLVFHASNALRLCAWMVAALRYEVWLMQIVMVFTSALVTVRSGEMVLYALLASRYSHGAPLARHRWLWTAYFSVFWLLSAWLFGGFSMPMLIDGWWSTLQYRVEIAAVVAFVVGVWLPFYMVASNTHHRLLLSLSLFTAQ